MSASAQTADDRPERRVEVELGGGWLGGAGLGSAAANLIANTPDRQPFTLFETAGRQGASPTVHVRGAFALSRRFVVEGGLVFGRPDVRVSTSADVEGGPSIAIVERIDQYAFEGGLLVLFDEMRLGTRTVPYAAAGAGYLRQLHEGLTVIEHGYLFHAGGGLKHWLMARDRGFVRAAGLRADARLYVLAAGVSVEDRPRPHPAISGSLFLTF